MEIIEYFSCSDKEKYLKQIESCDWSAAKFLAKHIKEGSIIETLGGWAKLFLLVDNGTLISFVTLSAQDCIIAPDLPPAPWLGFLHTAPEYRGNRYAQKILDYACDVAKSENYNSVYLATDHDGLYEKYGFRYLESRIDVWNDLSRIYIKEL